MKKIYLLIILVFVLIASGYTFEKESASDFKLESLANYKKEFVGEEIDVCSDSSVKSYMSYTSVTAKGSRQYQYIHKYMHVDETTGLLLNSDGFIGVALGSYFGNIGERYYFTLDSGVVLPLIKVEEKDDAHVHNGCNHLKDNSVIEFVVDSKIAGNYFGRYANGYVLQGNFDNYSLFKGNIAKIERVTEEVNKDYVEYYTKVVGEDINNNIFQYGSGY